MPHHFWFLLPELLLSFRLTGRPVRHWTTPADDSRSLDAAVALRYDAGLSSEVKQRPVRLILGLGGRPEKFVN